jgi:hypothetical protein
MAMRTLGLVAALVSVFIWAEGVAPPAAQAIQASGSIILSPSKQLQLAPGEEFEVTVSAVNTSSQTPLPPGPAAPATLTGPITIDLGCTDCGCTQKQGGALVFVAGGSAGCVSKIGAVTSCSGNDSVVTIDLGASGVALPADTTPVTIATIRLRMDAVSGPPLGIRAGTGTCALTACIAPGQGCVSCSAEGCTFVTPQQGNQPCNCPHACANKIRFIGDLAQPDFFELHAIIQTGGAFDPVGQPFTVSMANAGGQFLSFTLPPGSLQPQGANFRYSDGGVSTTGGIAAVQLTARDGIPGAYRIDIRGYSAALEPATTIPTDDGNINTSWEVGGESFSSGVLSWDRKAFGWQLTQFGLCQIGAPG